MVLEARGSEKWEFTHQKCILVLVVQQPEAQGGEVTYQQSQGPKTWAVTPTASVM